MRIALVGNPNVGKTTLFNALTGAHQEVANWPGTTVEYVIGKIRTSEAGEDLELVDLPGTYALTAYARDERVTRNFLLYEPYDAVIVVVNASSLERNLFLALEVLELTPHVVVALNMVDVAREQGITVYADELSRRLGVPVVPTVASHGTGLAELVAWVRRIGRRRVVPLHTWVVPYPAELREVLEPLAAALAEAALAEAARNAGTLNAAAGAASSGGGPADRGAPGGRTPAGAGRFRPEWVALRLLQGDEEITREVRVVPQGQRAARLALSCCAQSAGIDVELGDEAVALDPALLAKVRAQYEAFELQIADAKYNHISRLVDECVQRQPLAKQTITERLDAVLLHPFWGYPAMAAVFFAAFWLSFVVSAPLSDWVSNGITWLGQWAARGMAALGAPAFLQSLVVDGVFAGVGAVLSFVPYMTIFFAIYQLLQDSGYMARASVLVDRWMQSIGLHGKGFFALVSAYGCNVPAMAATRVMENHRDRLLACLVIPFIPCNARLGVMAVMTAAFFPGTRGAFVMMALLLISAGVVAGASVLYRKTVLPTDPAPLLIELPDYHVPSLRNLAIPTWHRVWMFVSRIWKFLLWATLATWALTYFPVGAPVDQSYAARLGHLLAPVGQLYGFDWRLMIAIVFGFVAKETTLSTLGVLYGAGADGASLPHLLAQSMTPLVAFTYLVVYMLYIPCLSTVIQMHRESGSWKWTAAGMAVNVGVAFSLGLVLERLLWLFG
ncbi:ferrous iron transport protein B [Alicyclobacillus macrosporangiidus]|uniref:Ferrous iron transport protein B n=1 Tax=Alicyclobacillus macrosporangiidus TaxID=392015 RepID=A0A1I7G8R8_9BACL|nr:ferrous iron transport protein B [Alicyclobacillus macrosporangiidus]SFU44844.1 ferrous iron transport protein B [Alicyclobacillus macrosporangiidus]